MGLQMLLFQKFQNLDSSMRHLLLVTMTVLIQRRPMNGPGNNLLHLLPAMPVVLLLMTMMLLLLQVRLGKLMSTRRRPSFRPVLNSEPEKRKKDFAPPFSQQRVFERPFEVVLLLRYGRFV